jgi:hypothetical protein
MILGFKQQFVLPIAHGTKIHTIREDKHDRWKPGKKIHMATGVRTKRCNKFRQTICTGVQTINILYIDNIMHVLINDKLLDEREVYQLALNDGFYSLEEFRKWFHSDFSGKIIHWTNFRY